MYKNIRNMYCRCGLGGRHALSVCRAYGDPAYTCVTNNFYNELETTSDR